MRISRLYSRLASYALLLLALGGLLLQPLTTITARAEGGSSLPILPVTLASLGPTVSGGPYLSVVGASGDWVVYEKGDYGCGHCNGSINTIYLRNVVNQTSYTIKSFTESYGRGDGTFGAEGVQFAFPFLIWRQPQSTVSNNSLSVLTKGDFACTICFFDVRSGKGGPVTALQALDPAPETSILPLAVDQSGSGRALVIHVQQAGSQMLLVDLNSGAIKTLPTEKPLNGDFVPSAVFAGAVIAWSGSVAPTANTNSYNELYVYNEAANRVVTLQANDKLFRLQSNGSALFYNTNDTGVTRYDPANGQSTLLPIASRAPDFMVAGNFLVWTEYVGDGKPSNLHVAQLDTQQEILSQPLTVAAAQSGNRATRQLVGLGDDKLLFLTSESTVPISGPPVDQRVDMAWLTSPNPAFANVWAKADAPVAAGTASRTWLWGPQPRYTGYEAYAEGVSGQHQVLYYDKSRMEVNNPQVNPNDPYYVTNGLLVVEMIGGHIQLGNSASISASVPCTIPVAGDPRAYNPLTPGYSTLLNVASVNGEHQASNRIGQPVDEAIDVNGIVSKDATHGKLTSYDQFAAQTGHNIPQVFSHYLGSMNATYGFDWTFVVGFPITEAYWTQMRVGGKDYPVLIQAFQRRVLTFVPDFDPNWRVQHGNVGQHYLEWRYTDNRIADPLPY